MKSSVSVRLMALLIVSLFAFDAVGQTPVPCRCPDGGEHICPKGTSACCWWDGKKCSGICIGKQTDARSFAAAVASAIEGEKVTVEDLNTDKQKYEELFKTLLEGKKPKGVYQIEYGERTINFKFTKQATDQINIVTRSLKDDGDFGTVKATKAMEGKVKKSDKP